MNRAKHRGVRGFWQGYGLLLIVRLGYILLATLEGYSSLQSFYSDLALNSPGPSLVRFFLVDIGLIIPVFLYTCQKRWLPAMFWKTFFWFVVVADIAAHVYVPPDLTDLVKFWPLTLFYYIYIPAYFALYRYAFRFSNKCDECPD